MHSLASRRGCAPVRVAGGTVSGSERAGLSNRNGQANEFRRASAIGVSPRQNCRKSVSLPCGKKVTPHTLRHTTAMDPLRRGVDITVIALWLGHESIETTQMYRHAGMAIKEKALPRANKSNLPPKRYRPTDHLLVFLESL